MLHVEQRDLRDVVACFSQLNRRAADKALLVSLLGCCLLELLIVIIDCALVVLRPIIDIRLALDTRRCSAIFCLADGVRDLGLWIFDMGGRVQKLGARRARAVDAEPVELVRTKSQDLYCVTYLAKIAYSPCSFTW